MRYGLKWPDYAKQWDAMTIKPGRVAEFNAIAHHLVALKDHYTPIETATGVPWYMIALIHMREASNDFSKALAQGDPWNRRSTHIPISGPFASFYESAVWALKHDGLNNVHDWRLEKQLYYHEIYNGTGYNDYHNGMPSPYIWGGTSIQRPGKYIRDGVFSSTTWDTQPGVAPIMRMMAAIDPTIKFTRED